MMTRPHLVAEAGTNHNGDIAMGRRLIDAAALSGADSVKFQMIFPDGLYLPRFYEHGSYRDSEVFAQRSAAALSEDDFRALAEHCREAGLPFSASVFDPRGVRLLDELNAAYIKIASCDLNYSRLIKAAADTGRPLILSTGMSTLDEIEQAMADLADVEDGRVVLMHCVSVYPCPTRLMNLGFIDTLRKVFGVPVGLSDHTENSMAAAIAIAKGATWIEKHLTLDRSLPGFDHAYAAEPAAFAAFAQDLAAAAESCAPRVEKVSADEQRVRTRARRALYAAHDIPAGRMIREQDVLCVRPEGPLCPNDLSDVLERTAARTIRQYEPLTWDMFETAVVATAVADSSEGFS